MSEQKPEFRIAAEIVIKHGDKVLVMKRAKDSDVAPDKWCVPAGKVRFDELPEDGAVRECKEETGIDAKVVKELDRRAVTIQKGGQDAYRLIFTYLMEATSPDPINNVIMNDEHSDYIWVTADELRDSKYNLLDATKNPILQGAFSN